MNAVTNLGNKVGHKNFQRCNCITMVKELISKLEVISSNLIKNTFTQIFKSEFCF